MNISIQIIEIYKEQILDLLNDKQQYPLEIREDHKGCTYIPNVVNLEIKSANELLRIIEYGLNKRKTGQTNMNENSSRSHIIITINLEVINKKNRTVSKLSLIDLAGCERINKSNTGGPNLINETKSEVIFALGEQASHIPYRNSKLTYLMKDNLGGNSKTLMIINISPADYNIDETYQALQYGQRVKKITNNSQKNSEGQETTKLKEIIKRLQEEIEGFKK